jgi:hypothetical protein
MSLVCLPLNVRLGGCSSSQGPCCNMLAASLHKIGIKTSGYSAMPLTRTVPRPCSYTMHHCGPLMALLALPAHPVPQNPYCPTRRRTSRTPDLAPGFLAQAASAWALSRQSWWTARASPSSTSRPRAPARLSSRCALAQPAQVRTGGAPTHGGQAGACQTLHAACPRCTRAGPTHAGPSPLQSERLPHHCPPCPLLLPALPHPARRSCPCA